MFQDTERECRKCGVVKPLTTFRQSKPGYRRRVCSECMDAAAVKWQEENRNRSQAWWRDYYLRNREHQIAKAEEWNANNRDKKKSYQTLHYQRLREKALMAYGGPVCSCCGEAEPKFLSIDHIENDGAALGRELGKPHGGHFLYKWLRDNNYPPGYQVLCHNCNQGKHCNGGVCPHQVKKA